MRKMQVMAVLDLMGGKVVRGVAGHRELYAPIQSRLVDSASPGNVARAFRSKLGLIQLYIADLDAITGDAPQWSVLEHLAADGFELLVDAGLRDFARAERLVSCGAMQVVAALETLPGPQLLRELIARLGPERVVFSLDLNCGRPLGDASGWETADPALIAGGAIELGATSLIVLDLSSVGTGRGVPTGDLCRRIADAHPQVTLISGGGIRDRSDLMAMRQAGLGGVLVASALHDGRIGKEDIVAAQSIHETGGTES